MLVKAPGTFSARWPDVIRRVALALLATVGVIAALAAVVGVVASDPVALCDVPKLLLTISAACFVALWILVIPEVFS